MRDRHAIEPTGPSDIEQIRSEQGPGTRQSRSKPKPRDEFTACIAPGRLSELKTFRIGPDVRRKDQARVSLYL